jgi:HEAT repeat protein
MNVMVRSRNIKTAALIQRIGEPDASRVSELIDGLKRADILERDAWCDLIKDVGASAVPGLIELLTHRDANIRWHAVDTLCEIDGNPESISAALASCLSDSDESIRVTSALGLSKYNAAADEAVPILIKCLHDCDDDCYDDECTKVEAAYALGEFSTNAMKTFLFASSRTRRPMSFIGQTPLKCSVKYLLARDPHGSSSTRLRLPKIHTSGKWLRQY